MNRLAIRIGNFFFRYRNAAFPIFIIALYALVPPPSEVFGSKRLELITDGLALAISVLGLATRAAVIGYAYIKRGGKGKRVYAADLVTEGLFGVSRNPLYLGNLLICVGMFLMHGNPYVFLFGTAVYVFVYACIVEAEEAYLGEKFGPAYRAYAADVPRWIPRFSRFREATEGMEFNFRRVTQTDYSTIATTLIVLALTEIYEELADRSLTGDALALSFLFGCVVLCGLFVLAVKIAKKGPLRASGPAPHA
jgi:protein-S-isoprenylcysteine O-methyltransferase Ste14